MLNKINFNTGKTGKKLLVLGAIHGDEVCGPQAINQIVDKINSQELVLINGEVTFLPICNQQAYQEGKRYCEQNLNRIIKKHMQPSCLEEEVATEVADYIEKADYVLDLHSMSTNGIPFAFQDYSDEETKGLVKAQQLGYVLVGWPELYSTNGVAEDFSTGGYAKMVGVTGVTVECGKHSDPKAAKVAEQCILNTLAHIGLTDQLVKTTSNSTHFIKMHDIIHKKKEGKFIKPWQHLDVIHKGEVIGVYDDGEEVKTEYDGYVILPSDKKKVGEEWFYLGYDI